MVESINAASRQAESGGGSQGQASEYFRRLGSLESTAAAMDVRLDRLERAHQIFEHRQLTIQENIATISELSRASAMSLTKLEQLVHVDHAELRDQLIAALRSAPQSNKAGSTVGMLLAALSLLVILALIMNGSLG